MKVITIANQKGGVGKTTTALCLGAQLENKGYKVLYIDLDKQANTSKVLNADTNLKGSYELLANKLKASDVIQITPSNENVISANAKLSTIENLLNEAINQVGKEYRLKESLKDVKGNYDYVIIDTAPSLDLLTINALTCTDYLIIVSNADTFSLDGIKNLNSIIEMIKNYTNPSLKIGGVLITRFNPNLNLNKAYKETLEDLATALNTKVYKTYIRENVSIRESQTLQQRITEYAPGSNGNKDYKLFSEEVLKDLKERA